LCLLISETAKTLINEDNARHGTIKVFEAIQNVQLNKHLFYVSCDIVGCDVLVLKCVEIGTCVVFMTVNHVNHQFI